MGAGGSICRRCGAATWRPAVSSPSCRKARARRRRTRPPSPAPPPCSPPSARWAATAARVCSTADAIEQAHRDGITAIVPAVENGHACGGDPARLRAFRDLGARYLTLTHTGHNALADSSNPRADLGDAAEEHGGLSPLGRCAIAELNRLGMLVDIAHVSKASMLQAAAAVAHAGGLDPFLHPRAVRQSAQSRRRATRRAARRGRCGAGHRGAAFPARRRQGIGGHGGRLRRPHRLCGARASASPMSASRRISTAAAASPAGTTPASAPTSPPNCSAAAMARREIGLLWGGNFLRVLRLAEQRAA